MGLRMTLDVRAPPPFAAVANVNAQLTALHTALPARTELFKHEFVSAGTN